jgi:hypothetical protein
MDIEPAFWDCCGDPTNTASSYARCTNPHCHRRKTTMAKKRKKRPY